MRSIKILLIADEKRLASFLRRVLRPSHCRLEAAQDIVAARRLAQARQYDVILVANRTTWTAWKMESRGGSGSSTPVIVLGKRILEAGRPGRTKEIARKEPRGEIVALMERIRTAVSHVKMPPARTVENTGLFLNSDTRAVRRGGREITLTAREFALLEFFMKNKNRVLSRAVISEKIWSYDFDTGTNVIDVYVNHLRGKIDNGFDKKVIHTVRGVGYFFKDE